MESPTDIVRLRQPEEIDDPLTDVLRAGARRLLAQAVEMKADAFLSAMQDLRLPDEHQTCLAHLARDVAYAVEVSDDPVPWRLQL